MVKEMPGYDTNNSSEIKYKIKVFVSFLAFMYLGNVGKSRYVSILTGLNTQQSLGNDQYPRTVIEASNVLSNHKLDTALKPKKSQTTKN
jgi:hypothetical protein